MKMSELAISDAWFSNGGFECYKVPNPVHYELAQEAGTIQTLEGPVSYDAGFYVMTGPKGEKYPIPPAKFKELYDDNGDGTATPKKIIKMAKVADHPGAVDTSWGEKLNYNTGDDVIVKHGPNDYGVVKKDIFAQTYRTIK